jgi:hypothetical protein
MYGPRPVNYNRIILRSQAPCCSCRFYVVPTRRGCPLLLCFHPSYVRVGLLPTPTVHSPLRSSPASLNLKCVPPNIILTPHTLHSPSVLLQLTLNSSKDSLWGCPPNPRHTILNRRYHSTFNPFFSNTLNSLSLIMGLVAPNPTTVVKVGDRTQTNSFYCLSNSKQHQPSSCTRSKSSVSFVPHSPTLPYR